MGSGVRVELIAVEGIPRVTLGDDIAELVHVALGRAGVTIQQGDVVVLAQKIVSKAEGRCVDLATVRPSEKAREYAVITGKDSRIVELILAESRRVLRAVPNIMIVEHRLGFIMANAGIDQSNAGDATAGECAVLLPEDPDASAEGLRQRLAALCGVAPGVVINDSFGRPWRLGSVGVAIGAAGLPALMDRRGDDDLFGRKLEITVVALADEIASAASMIMGAGNEGLPAILMRGLPLAGPGLPARAIIRSAGEDLFP